MKRTLALATALVLSGSVLVGTAAAAPIAGPRTPSAGSTVAVGEPVLIAGTAANGESGDVTGVDITFDGGATWSPTEYGGERWLYRHTPAAEGPVTYHLRASGSQGPGAVTGPYHFFAGGSAEPPALGCSSCPLFLPALPDRPTVADADQAAVELGLRLSFDRPGFVAGATIHRGAYTGPLTVHLWSADGALLAQAVSAAEPYVSTVTFPSRVPVVAGREYVVSYFTPAGGYASTEDYFTGAVVIAPHTMAKSAGVYAYGGGFPTETWHDSNYWVQPRFELS
ncbi:DUF4082 domain-containing protein [Actinosynnema sp. NPDC004786]